MKKKEDNIARFDAVEIVTSERYKEHANMLDTILEPDKAYSHDEVEKLLNKALKTPVKVEINQ